MDDESRAFFETLMTAEPPPAQRHLRLLLENQLATLRSKKGRCVWHVEVLDWCTDVYRRNPGAYQHMAHGGFLKLPHADTVRKLAARANLTSGECRELYDALRKRVEGLPPGKALREMALLFDEINIVGDAAFKVVKGEYRFFGFIDVPVEAPNLYGAVGAKPKEVNRADFLKRQVATHTRLHSRWPS